jgi:hypothetical protein
VTCKLAAANVGDKLGLGRLAFCVAVVFKARGADTRLKALFSWSKGWRSVSVIGGVATALGKDVYAANTDGLIGSSNEALLFWDVDVRKDDEGPLLDSNGSSSDTSGVWSNVASGEPD